MVSRDSGVVCRLSDVPLDPHPEIPLEPLLCMQKSVSAAKSCRGGPALTFSQPDVLLIAGGIGVTPMHNTLRFLAQGGAPGVERVHLVWAARSPQVFELFAETLPAEASSCAVELSLSAGPPLRRRDCTRSRYCVALHSRSSGATQCVVYVAFDCSSAGVD